MKWNGDDVSCEEIPEICNTLVSRFNQPQVFVVTELPEESLVELLTLIEEEGLAWTLEKPRRLR